VVRVARELLRRGCHAGQRREAPHQSKARLAILDRGAGGSGMTTMSIANKHRLSHKQAKAAAQKVADDLKERFDLQYTWRGDKIEFERPGLAGEMHVGRTEV